MKSPSRRFAHRQSHALSRKSFRLPTRTMVLAKARVPSLVFLFHVEQQEQWAAREARHSLSSLLLYLYLYLSRVSHA